MVTANGCDLNRQKDSGKYDCLRSVVKIYCGPNEGTAICVHFSDSFGHLFLSCAHVVQHKIQKVILRHDGHVIRGSVIYATPKDVPHDIAVIISKQTPEITPCQISDITHAPGHKVFAVGYACKENVTSTIFGRVLSISLGLLTTTCNVCKGFSGGPVFTNEGKLLGLTIGKLSVGTVNFVLPSAEFVETIKTYIHTNDLTVLNNLESKCSLRKFLWNNGNPNFNIICHV
ncbi:peroxisomal leader peptide-processing protease-like isoform X2 [Sipha flava]|uniref:Peroxisomal leader peptide-processing protease n=1 Tax=Sipha flava TaxID=143950 RepID=A0A8B8FLL4_9HEMI|nr:peroxisomal leader peptide-processing protease-like isoform X2 [Sipha flava]